MSEAVEMNQPSPDLSVTEANDGNYNSFDDLDQMTSSKSDSEVMQEAIKEVKDSNNDTKKVMAEIKEDISSEKVSTKEKQENLSDIGDEVEAELVEEIKKLKGSFNNEELEVPQDALFSVKVDGEEVNVSLQELRNNWSGKTAWDKKFQELSQDRKQFTEQKNLVEKYVGEFGQLARAGDKMGAMQYLASLSGMDALQFRRELRSQVLEEYKQTLDMNEHEQKAFEAQEENQFLKHKIESESKLAAEHRQQQEVRQQVMEIQEALGVDEDQWESLVSEVSEEIDGEITPEIVGQYAYAKEVYNTAESLLSDLDPSLTSDEDLVEEVAEIMLKEPQLTHEDIMDIIQDGLGLTEKRKPSKKAKASAKKNDEEQPQKKSSTSKIDKLYSFDQLDD